MAVLDAANRLATAAQAMRNLAWPTFTKTELRNAVNAADDWADSNAASYNAALPANFRTNATVAQKAAVLAYICMRRAGLLNVEGE